MSEPDPQERNHSTWRSLLGFISGLFWLFILLGGLAILFAAFLAISVIWQIISIGLFLWLLWVAVREYLSTLRKNPKDTLAATAIALVLATAIGLLGITIFGDAMPECIDTRYYSTC